MKKELPKAYEPREYEDKIYKKWEESGYFNPDKLKLSKDAKPHTIMMPPPNVTGVLHLGHALENALMDIMIRYQRMRGKKTLLLPGTDHAAVATQAKVEKELIKKGIKNPRQELGREKLLEEIRKYAENSKSTIIEQIKKMGTSCDWSRTAYTFDEERTKAVNEVFTRMYKDGLIEKDYRVINWSVKGQSTCSDDEIVYVERQAAFYTFKYSKDFPFYISTTRPETKLGDTAVAVNPQDKRYKKFIGKEYPVVGFGGSVDLKIKIIADENVDPAFGTGALGVTPAHSSIDFDIYMRQKAMGEKIKIIQVIDQDGKMTANAGSAFASLNVIEAREKLVQWLKENSLLEKEENITQNVGTSDRFGDIIESLPMKQWFINVNKKIPGKNKSLKDLMREAVTVGHNNNPKQKVKITPERFEKIYLNWIDNLRDWCISRQIWWGHRIPVWYKREEIYVGAEPPKGDGWEQDPDTLDTWFSSGLWTFSTLGWPAKTEDFKTYHPTSWMQMGYEILFFWMARMILMSTYALDDIPFKNVYIHGMLRDKDGQKFSKSLGTGVDPIEVCEKYGTDALRLSLILGISPGNDSKFYEEKVEGARNLVNKLWNVSRFILSSVDIDKIKNDNNELPLPNTIWDDWIICNFNSMLSLITEDIDNYRFSQAGESLREFTRDYLANWYLEITKFEKNKGKNKDEILIYLLKNLLKLWHPFMPFVTEAIWKEIERESLLMIRKWPEYQQHEAKNNLDKNLDKPLFQGGNVEIIKNIIISIRNARAENKVDTKKKIKAVIYAGNKKKLIKSQARLIKSLRTGIKDLEIKENGPKIKDAIYISAGEVDIYLIGAIDKKKEKSRIEKEIKNLENLIKNTENKLKNKEFAAKAPKEIVGREKENLKIRKGELKKLGDKIKELK